MCCNDRHMARKQVGGRILERYWTSQSEEHREPHQLVLLEVLDNTLSVGTVELHMTAESWGLGNIEHYQNVEGRQVLWEQMGWILEAQN